MPSFPWVGRSGLGFLLVPFGFPQSFIQLGTSPNRKNLEVSMGIKINVLWDILISARHESGVVSWSNLVPLGVMWEWWESSGRREGPKFCLWPDHSFHIPLYLSLAFSLCSLNSEPTTYNLFSPSSPLESPNPTPPPTPFHIREAIIVLRLCSCLKKSGASNSGCWEISSP